MILLEPSECRQGTRLPQAMIKSGVPVNGLEAHTGGDFIISSLEAPRITRVTKAPVTQLQLRKHITAGLLVQRKDGRDFLSSIPDLASIQSRMLPWCDNLGPALVTIGRFESGAQGKVALEGERTKTTWKAYTAAKLFWQARGGMVVELANARELVTWTNWAMSTFLPKVQQTKIVVDRLPAQALVRPSNPWWAFLMAFPHIGEQKAKDLARALGPKRQTLAHALAFISDLGNASLDVPGYGKGTFKDCHEALGIEPYERLRVESAELPKSGRGVVLTWPKDETRPVPDDGRYIYLPSGELQEIVTGE